MYGINFPPENARNTGIWNDDNDNPRIRERAIDWLLNDQKEKDMCVLDTEGLEESKYICDHNKVYRDGVLLSVDFLRTISISQQIYKHVIPKTVIEIGAGAGHLARTICLQTPCKYVIIDLPETLCFSYGFLKLNFPDKKFLWATSTEELSTYKDYDFVFVPVQFAEGLAGESFDLFVNTASMGEMKNHVIHHWMGFIQDSIKVNYLFTLNRFLNVIPTDWSGRWSWFAGRVQENHASVSYDSNWNILNWESEPSYTRCPYIDTLHARYVEIIASRPSSLTQDEKITKSGELLQEVVDQDWVRLQGIYDDGIATARNNILVNDTTITGTLYKLWESIRLNTTRDNVSYMLRYLDRITIDKPTMAFEEQYYYQELAGRLG
jgi:hypothetical protein